MSLLGTLIYGVRKVFGPSGEAVSRDAIEFVNCTVSDDTANRRTVVTYSPAALPTGTSGQLLQHSGADWAAVNGIDAGKIASGTLPIARGGTGISVFATGNMMYATGPTSMGLVALGSAGKVLQSNGVSPYFEYPYLLRTRYGTNIGQVGGLDSPATNQMIALTEDGGYAVRMTNKTGGPSVKGTILKLDDTWRITGESVPGQLSNPSFTGTDWDSSDGGRLYLTVTVPGGAATVSAYSDSGRTTKVAEGTLAIGGNAGGTITLTNLTTPGVTGTVTIVASAVEDLTPQANQGSDNGVQICSPTTDGAPMAGVMYSQGIADGSDVWVVVHGLAYVVVKGVPTWPCPAGAYLYMANNEDPEDYGKALWEPERTAEGYNLRGVGRAIRRTTSGALVLTRLDLRGVGPTTPQI